MLAEFPYRRLSTIRRWRVKAVARTIKELGEASVQNDRFLAVVKERHPRTSLRDIVRETMFLVTDPKTGPSLKTRL